jgi:ADP-ribose pyrophosphatase YjhB (NUDIX family)
MKERFKMIASGYLLLVRNGKILLSRRFQTGYMDGSYSFPAGHIEDNESLTTGTSREICEEIGIDVKPTDLKLVHVMHRKSNDIRMDFFFTTEKAGLVPKNMEPNKCDDLSWFPINNLPTNTIPYIRTAIENYQKHIFYSEFGWG